MLGHPESQQQRGQPTQAMMRTTCLLGQFSYIHKSCRRKGQALDAGVLGPILYVNAYIQILTLFPPDLPGELHSPRSLAV
jgi:hypothetical protein